MLLKCPLEPPVQGRRYETAQVGDTIFSTQILNKPEVFAL